MPTTESITAALQAAGLRAPALSVVASRRPVPLFGFPIAAQESVAELNHLRAATDRTGLYPLLISDPRFLMEGDADKYTPPVELVSKAAKIDPVQWLRKEMNGCKELFKPTTWPDNAERQTELTIPYKTFWRSSKPPEPRENLFILLFPTRVPWEANAHLAFTAWNYDIFPEHHIAIHKYWFERYGAEPAASMPGVLEFRVAKPPTDRQGALSLAKEQGAYCNDIIIQGTGTVEALAASLLNAPVWHFWWD